MNSCKRLPFRQNINPLTDYWSRVTSSHLRRRSTPWAVGHTTRHFNPGTCNALRLFWVSGAVCIMQWQCAVWSGWCTKVRIWVRQNKIPLQTLIDEIEKQLTTTWTVDFVDSKPYYKSLVILPYAVHCACVIWGAVCKMQKQYAVWSMWFT